MIVAAIEREKSGELSDVEAVHVALDGLRKLGVPIGPRPPNDSHPDLGNQLLDS